MIRIEQTTKARRKLFPSDEYCINKNGEYFYLTKVELQKMACDLKLLGIADVIVPFVCDNCQNKEGKELTTSTTHCKECE